MSEIKTYDTPYKGLMKLVVGKHYELTGKTRLVDGWFGRLRVEHEVIEWFTVDEGGRFDMDLSQHRQNTLWAR